MESADEQQGFTRFEDLLWRMARSAYEHGAQMPRVRVDGDPRVIHDSLPDGGGQLVWVYGTPFGDIEVIGRGVSPSTDTPAPQYGPYSSR